MAKVAAKTNLIASKFIYTASETMKTPLAISKVKLRNGEEKIRIRFNQNLINEFLQNEFSSKKFLENDALWKWKIEDEYFFRLLIYHIIKYSMLI